MKKVIVELLVDEERLGSVNGYEDMDLHDALNSELEVMRENGVQALDWRVVKPEFKLADIFKDDTPTRPKDMPIRMCNYHVEPVAFESHAEAARVREQMEEIVDMYGWATVADLHDLIAMPSVYTDIRYGWRDVRKWEIKRTRGRYELIMTDVRPESELERSASGRYPRHEYKNDKAVHKFDNVNHPSHYQTSKGFETIDVMTEYTKGMDNVEAINTAQVIKYICRWNRKNGIEDLNKAKWYLNKLIEYKENEDADD